MLFDCAIKLLCYSNRDSKIVGWLLSYINSRAITTSGATSRLLAPYTLALSAFPLDSGSMDETTA